MVKVGMGWCAAWRPVLARLGAALLLALAVAMHAPAWAATDAPPTAQIRAAQEALRGLGYDPGTPDGRIGGRTRRAVEAFQGANGLPVTGDLNDATIARLLSPPPGQPLVRAPRTSATGPIPPAVPVGQVESTPLPGSTTDPAAGTPTHPGGPGAGASGGFDIGNYAGLALLVIAVISAVGGLVWISRHPAPETGGDEVTTRLPPTLGRRQTARDMGLRATLRGPVPANATATAAPAAAPSAVSVAKTEIGATVLPVDTAAPIPPRAARQATVRTVVPTAATMVPPEPAPSDDEDDWPADPRARTAVPGTSIGPSAGPSTGPSTGGLNARR